MTAFLELEEFTLSSDPFQGFSQGSAAMQISQKEAQLQKSVAYDEGYKAGWDDATKTQKQETTHVGVELAKNLQDLSFTFHEARVQVMNALQPMVVSCVEKLLPDVAADTLLPILKQQLAELSQIAATTEMQLLVAPESLPAVQKMLVDQTGYQVEILAEETLGEGQAILRAGPISKEIDLDRVLVEIRTALAALYENNSREVRHG